MGAREYEETAAAGYSDAEAADVSGGAYANFGLGNIDVACRDRSGYFRTLVEKFAEVQIIKPGASRPAGAWKVRFDAGHSPGHMSLMDHTRHLFIGVDFLFTPDFHRISRWPA